MNTFTDYLQGKIGDLNNAGTIQEKAAAALEKLAISADMGNKISKTVTDREGKQDDYRLDYAARNLKRSADTLGKTTDPISTIQAKKTTLPLLGSYNREKRRQSKSNPTGRAAAGMSESIRRMKSERKKEGSLAEKVAAALEKLALNVTNFAEQDTLKPKVEQKYSAPAPLKKGQPSRYDQYQAEQKRKTNANFAATGKM